MVEIPLNSPEPLESIALLADALSERGRLGAGTVLEPGQVSAVAAAGAQFVVSPNLDLAVVAAARQAGLDSFPGVFTPTECFSALSAGAVALKVFPAEIIGPAGIRALRAVLPPRTSIFAVGGVEPSNFATWRRAGTNGFGIGSYLYTPDRTTAETLERAEKCVAAYDALLGNPQAERAGP